MLTNARLFLLPISGIVAGFVAAPCLAQPQGDVGRFSDVTIENTVLEPEKLNVSDTDQLTDLISAPEGFDVEVFARDLINPRMLAVAGDGTVYATRRSVGDVVMLRDEDGDGRADTTRSVASRPGLHGIAIDGDRVFLATNREVYVGDIRDDGGFGELRRIIDDLPDAGQHPNRTLAVGPDDKLYISVGSTCNACEEDNPENATILRAEKDGSFRTIFARRLRNTIGFDWEPETGVLYGMDHGIDWLGDEEQIEELNRIEQGRQYGWPYVYGMSAFNPQDKPPEGISHDQWAQMSTEPLMGYTPHSAPMQMVFYEGGAFPEEYRGDAFVAMRGSWNRRPPSGYEVLRIDFENGEPARFEHFLEGFLIEQEDGSYGYLGRLAGIAAGPDGSLYVSDDSNGVIYRVTHSEATEADSGASSAETPDTVAAPRQSEIALDLVDAQDNATLDVQASFDSGASIPATYVADGDNASPGLEWSGAPEDTRSFAILMEDPDAPAPTPFVHWIVYDIPADVTSLREGLPTTPVLPDPEGVKQGTNDRGSIGYFGPKPPVGDEAHSYHFQIFALDLSSLDVDPGATREDVLEALEGHVLAKGEITGRYERPAEARGQ